jgi:hypothetical protein
VLVEFADDIVVTYVMGGLAREFRTPVETMRHVLDAAAASGMPTDPRLWLDAPSVSSYPACQAVKAAADQGLDGPYLRVVREAQRPPPTCGGWPRTGSSAPSAPDGRAVAGGLRPPAVT